MAREIRMTAGELADLLTTGKSFTAGALGIPGTVHGIVPYNLLGQEPPKRRKKRKKADKAAQPYVAGLMVRAGDTGRVLMLQRAITEDDPAAGKLEPPGGHAEPGEVLTQAAAREWQEETGFQLPSGHLTGSWDSADGIYRGYVYEVPSEDVLDLGDGRDQVWNPDNPDGTIHEAILWVDPEMLSGNPMMREEMQRDLPQVLAALRGEDAQKSARTPMLSTTHNPLGPHGLWRTPDKHVPVKQSLPPYAENIAHALERAGHSESESVAMAISALRDFAAGHAFGGRVRVTPEVRAAARRALRQWERLKESHH